MGVGNCCHYTKTDDEIGTNKIDNKNKGMIICTYDIKEENADIQIINDRYENFINEEIELKIKILNGKKIEKLNFKKQFKKAGINTIIFIAEEKLNKMNFIFHNCSSLKEIKFKSFETSQIWFQCFKDVLS